MRTFWETLLCGGLILGTIGIGRVMVRHWTHPAVPSGSASMDVGRAPESTPGDSATRGMDHWDNAFERQADGTIHHKAWRVSVHGREAVGTSTSLRIDENLQVIPDTQGQSFATEGLFVLKADDSREIARIHGATSFVGFGVTSPQCPITIRADDGREACLDWRGGTVTVSGDLPVAESARLFVEALSTVAPWPPACAP